MVRAPRNDYEYFCTKCKIYHQRGKIYDKHARHASIGREMEFYDEFQE